MSLMEKGDFKIELAMETVETNQPFVRKICFRILGERFPAFSSAEMTKLLLLRGYSHAAVFSLMSEAMAQRDSRPESPSAIAG